MYREPGRDVDMTDIQRAQIHEAHETKRKAIEEREKTKRAAFERRSERMKLRAAWWSENGFGAFLAIVVLGALVVGIGGLLAHSWMTRVHPVASDNECQSSAWSKDNWSSKQCENGAHLVDTGKAWLCVCPSADGGL